MATTEFEENQPRIITPRNSRRNEIIAVLLFAVGLLLALCLVSAAFYPGDPSWNSAGQTETHNWTGTIGANVAALLLQFVGLAAYLRPCLLLAAAWRRFKTRTFRAPLSRLLGLIVLTLAAAALLSISNIQPIFDSSVQPGGLVGTLISRGLASGLNTVGATVLLIAVAAMGLLLATNFSFVTLYEKIVEVVVSRFAFISNLPQKFKVWRQARSERKRLRKEEREILKAEQLAARANGESLEGTPEERIAEYMKESSTKVNADAINRGEARMEGAQVTVEGSTEPARAAAAGAGIQSGTVDTRSGRRSIFPGARGATAASDEEPEVEEMVKGASVLRPKGEAPATGRLPFDADRTKRVSYSDYSMPPLDFLNEAPPHSEQADAELLGLATRLAEKCKEFNVTGQIKHICPGPVVTTYEFKPDPGVKYSRVVSLVDDLCLALKAESIRIDRMPGKPHVGIEVPNPRRETIFLREVIESRAFRESGSKLTIALGKTIDGLNYVADLAKMPHLLIAGTTGAGKSVGVNALIVSILYRARPDEVKFILIDPKRLELGLYADIPHLATPIITDPKVASRSLKWAVKEMEQRYKDLAGWGVRNIDG
ncbi:MAG: segregation ATPase FtsK/SpoIIIE, family, partial [Thermoleophilales bacterium]|nr:segregation ATPase FtsK/SpoIIIE, family [Thermoleophilales bacterium]